MEVNINGVDIQPAVGTPQTPASGGVDPGQQQQQQQQQQGPADGMIISTFPNHPTSPSLALAGLMTLDGPDLENEYVLAGGEHSENGQARDFTAGDSLFGSGTDSVHRSVHIKLDLKVTTTTKRTG